MSRSKRTGTGLAGFAWPRRQGIETGLGRFATAVLAIRARRDSTPKPDAVKSLAMELLLIRHGEAVGEAPGLGDAGRFLTEKGRRITRRAARWLAKRPKRCPAVIWTSPLVRAVQTAEILAEVAGVRAGVQVVAELSPGRDPKDLVALLRGEVDKDPLALVGHEPSLSLLAAALLGTSALPGFKKSAVVALTWQGEPPASFVFAFDPKTQATHKTIASLREPPSE